jgi:hypothetical protein
MLILEERDLISRGKWRACYRHPTDLTRCVKVITNQSFGELKKKTIGNIYRKLIAPKLFSTDTNDKEWKHYKKLCVKGSKISRYVVKLYGFDETNLGRGLLAELITDYNGQISATFRQYLASGKNLPINFKELIDNFCNDLVVSGVRLYDLNLDNLALQQVSKGVYVIKIIDVKGAEDSKSLLPLDRIIAPLAAAKMRRRIARFRKRLGLLQ